MNESTQQEVQRLQQEIAQKQMRIFELLYEPTTLGTVSAKMRRYMEAHKPPPKPVPGED